MLDNILPENLQNAVERLNEVGIYEIRLRINKPVVINYFNSHYYLGEKNLSDNKKDGIICTKALIEQVLAKASNHSIYAVNEQIKNGYISVSGGIRIGIAGEVVMEKGEVITIKNYSSLVIRVPHQIYNCSHKILNLLLEDNELQNTLIISPPGAGKTTYLRDLCLQLSHNKIVNSLLLIDERNELASVVNSVPELEVGEFTDIISGGTKQLGIQNGVRSLSPQVVCVDELGTIQDIESIEFACSCGVKVIATIHAKDLFELINKPNMERLLTKKLFKRFVVLSSREGKGTIEGVFNSNLELVTN